MYKEFFLQKYNGQMKILNQTVFKQVLDRNAGLAKVSLS